MDPATCHKGTHLGRLTGDAPCRRRGANATGGGGGVGTRRGSFAQRIGERHRAAGRAGDAHAARHLSRNEGIDLIRPPRPSAEVRGQSQAGIPAAGHGEGIDRQPRDAPLRVANGDALHAACAVGVDHVRTEEDARLEPLGTLEYGRCDLTSRIDDGLDRNAGGGELKSGPPAVIARGEYRDAPSRRHGEAVQVAAHRGRQHDAGSIVAAENDRPFDRAGREHRAHCDDLPQPLTRQMGRRLRQMVRDALQRPKGSGAAEPVVVCAKHRSSLHQTYFRHRTQFGLGPPRPIAAAQVVDFMALEVEAPAEQKILIAENDPGAAASGGERSSETGRAATDDEHIAECVCLLVRVRIRLVACATETGRAPNQRFVNFLPERRRPHESLVVETGDEDGR